MKNLKLSTLLTAGVFALFSANASALILSFESSAPAVQEPEMTVAIVEPESVRDAAHAKKDALDHKAAVRHLVEVAQSDERKKIKEDKE